MPDAVWGDHDYSLDYCWDVREDLNLKGPIRRWTNFRFKKVMMFTLTS